VIWLMIALVVIQILVVWAWGVEPRNRGLEDVSASNPDGMMPAGNVTKQAS
jgi:hypothetical protein